MCNYQPELVTGPIGMFHCPQCGEMVIAGYPHPDYFDIDKSYAKYLEDNEVPGDLDTFVFGDDALWGDFNGTT